MAINFPSTPTVGQTFVIGTKVYTWDGTRWTFDFRNLAKGTTAERPTVDKPFVYYNTTLRVYEVWRPEYSVWEAVLTYPIQETLIDPTITYSEASYTTPGTYQWECPAGVAYVHVVCVGGGGGAITARVSDGANSPVCGAGGGLGWKNNIAVTPGQLYTVEVGAGGISFPYVSGNPTSNSGGDSYFIDTSTVAGFGAVGANSTTARLGGSFTGDGGGNGGSSINYVSTRAPGAGGAGGYSGNGGTGGYYNGATSIAAESGTGGAGGGGGYCSFSSGNYSGSGGGVGILGEGTSGAAGASTVTAGSPGGGGSGASTLSNGNLAGGLYGGGASIVVTSQAIAQHGGGGAVRIIWGAGRAFPSTNTGVI